MCPWRSATHSLSHTRNGDSNKNILKQASRLTALVAPNTPRQEGLNALQRQPKRNREWLNGGSCLRLRPEHPNHVWAHNFLTDRMHDKRAFRLLTIVDKFARECLAAIVVARKRTADDALATLPDLFIARGCPTQLRSDNGPEFCARIVQEWRTWLKVRALVPEPGSPWENGQSVSFNGKLQAARAFSMLATQPLPALALGAGLN